MKKTEALNILGLSSNASNSQIKSAYRLKASQHHPDKGGSADKFKQVNEACRLLKSITVCPYCQGTGVKVVKKNFHSLKIICLCCK